MESIYIEGTKKSPEVKSDSSQGLVEIRGRSDPEDSIKFYTPLIDWAEEYIKAPREKTTINIALEHFNSSSSKCILSFLRNFVPLYQGKYEIIVNWYYDSDDEEMLEAGETYQELTGLPFNMIGV